MIRIAQAGSDERYQYKNGEAGDQRKGKPDANGCFTGELNVEPWYNKPWDYVIRPNNEAVANTIAGTIHAICENKNVGYDQNQAETLWDAFDRLGWSPLAIPNLPLCECDCCRLVDVAVRMAGITNIPNLKHKYTGNIKDALVNSGHFTAFEGKEYTQSTANLKRGDLLLSVGHHICVVLDTSKVDGTTMRIWNCLACCLRNKPNTTGKVLKYLHPGDIVVVKGYAPSGWGNVTYNGITGYVSPKFLQAIRQLKVTAGRALWLRSGAGTQNNALISIPSGTILNWDGRTAKVGSTTWYGTAYGGYNGYASGMYLKVM